MKLKPLKKKFTKKPAKATSSSSAAPRKPPTPSAMLDVLVQAAKRGRERARLLEAIRREDQYWRDTHPGHIKPAIIQQLRQTPNTGLNIP